MRSVPATGSKTSAARTPSAESPAIDRDLGEVGVEVGLALRVDLPRGDLAPLLLEDPGQVSGSAGQVGATGSGACGPRRRPRVRPVGLGDIDEPAEPLARDAGEAPAKRPAQAPRKTPLEAVESGGARRRWRGQGTPAPRHRRESPSAPGSASRRGRARRRCRPPRNRARASRADDGAPACAGVRRIQVRGHPSIVRRHGFAAHDGRSHYARPRRPSPPVAPPPDPIDAGERQASAMIRPRGLRESQVAPRREHVRPISSRRLSSSADRRCVRPWRVPVTLTVCTSRIVRVELADERDVAAPSTSARGAGRRRLRAARRRARAADHRRSATSRPRRVRFA